jgi:hypothetical protein
MQLIGTVIAIELDTMITKADGSSKYPGWRLTYRTSDGKVQEIAKHANSLKFTKGLKSSLMTLSEGDKFVVQMEKNGQYNEIVSITKGDEASTDLPVPSAPTRSSGGSVTVKSNYETSEERAARQLLIVRQSSLSNALQYFEVTKGKPSVDDVLNLANQFADFVFNKQEEVKVSD